VITSRPSGASSSSVCCESPPFNMFSGVFNPEFWLAAAVLCLGTEHGCEVFCCAPRDVLTIFLEFLFISGNLFISARIAAVRPYNRISPEVQGEA
jgi:hypothetical protein